MSLRIASAIVVAVLTATTIPIAVAGAQPLVRVRAETRIELAPRREAERLIIEGALRDDLGAPLVDRPLRIELHEGSRSGQQRERAELRTSTGGAFRATLDVPLGAWWVSARYEGDEHHAPQEVSREVLLGREHVRLDVEIEGGPTLDLDRAEHAMRVRARSAAGGADLAVTVSENGRVLARGTTEADGTVAFALSSAEIGPPSAARLVVRSEPDAHRGDAQTEVPIVRFRRSTLTLAGSRSEVGPGETVRLSGALLTSEGPLVRKAVGLWAGDRHLGTALTDDAGEFAAVLGWNELGAHDGVVVARFEADAPWWGASESAPIELRVEAPSGTPWSWIAISIAVSALLFAVAGRRRRPIAPGGAALPVTAPPIELGARRSILPDSLEISGRVIDARSETPVAGASVRVRRGDHALADAITDDGGRFAITLPVGTHALEIEARGYEIARHRATLPHRGEWSAIVVRVRSLRGLAWEPLRPVAARLLPSPDLWGVWTGRDLEAAARARPPASATLLDLIGQVERACYAPEPPSAEDLDAIRRAADSALDEMSHPVPPLESPQRAADRRPPRAP